MSDRLEPGPVETVELSEAELKACSRRNMALGLCLGALVLIFMGTTMFKIGANLSRVEREI